MRERVAFLLMIFVLVFLFAFVFAILGRGSYEPGGSVEDPATHFALVSPSVDQLRAG